MMKDCGRTIKIVGGHTMGCGVCPACIESEQEERLAEDAQFVELGLADLERDCLKRNAKLFIGIFTGSRRDYDLARYAEREHYGKSY